MTPAGPDAAPPADDSMWRAQAQSVLAAHLDDDDVDVASSCAVALGKTGDLSHAPALVAVLVDDRRRETEREAAAIGLGLLGGPDATARRAVERVARNSRERTQLRALCVYALGLRGEAESMPFLLAAAHDDEATWDVPAAALSSLGALRDDLVRADLEERLEGGRRAKRFPRVYAAQGLARAGDPAALPVLAVAARDDDEHVRRAAYLAIGALAGPDDDIVPDVLVRAVHREKNRGARHAAALALGTTGHARADAALRHLYEKGDSLDQHFGALAIGLLARTRGDPAAAAGLETDLADRANADLRGALAIALGLARRTEAAAPLRKIVSERGNPTLRAHAALALGMLGRPVDAELLRATATSERDAVVRREAALALGLLGDRAAVPALAEQIERGATLYVQGASAIGLGYIGGAEAARTLSTMISDRKRPAIARALAASGLGILLDKSDGHRLAEVAAHLDWATLTQTVHEILRIP